jgi:t-SNARE complex subunit (syntaxin)
MYIDESIDETKLIVLIDNNTDDKERIISLNNEIILLQQMFIDINRMIIEQGETIDNIEDTTESTKINVIKAEEDLIQTQEYKTTYNKIVGIIFGIVSSFISIKFIF